MSTEGRITFKIITKNNILLFIEALQSEILDDSLVLSRYSIFIMGLIDHFIRPFKHYLSLRCEKYPLSIEFALGKGCLSLFIYPMNN